MHGPADPPAHIGDPTLTPHTGRSLYDRFIGVPDNELRAYAALDPGAPSDPVLRQFETVRRRLDQATADWNVSTRVLVYGAGQHTRMMLAAYPAIGPFIRGFIDSSPRASVACPAWSTRATRARAWPTRSVPG